MIKFVTNGSVIEISQGSETDGFSIIRNMSSSSKNITWSYGSDVSRIDIVIDNISYDSIPAAQISFDGVYLTDATGFKDAVEVMFPNLAGSGSPGESSYLVYTAALSQDNSNVYSCVVFEDTIGITSITQNGSTTAKINSSGAFTNGKTVTIPFGDWAGNANVYLPISDAAAILGYYTISPSLNSIFIDFVDAAFAGASLYSLVGGTAIFIEIRVYP